VARTRSWYVWSLLSRSLSLTNSVFSPPGRFLPWY
jgi:hypothetical protein